MNSNRTRSSLYQNREAPPPAIQERHALRSRFPRHGKHGRKNHSRVRPLGFRLLLLLVAAGLGLFILARYRSLRGERRPAPLRPVAERAAVPSPSPVFRAGAGQVQLQVREWIENARQATVLVEECRRMALRGLEHEPVERLRRQLETTPHHLGVLGLLGDLLLAKGDGHSAIEAYGAALSAQPSAVDVRFRLAQALMLIEDYASALDATAWVLEAEPNRIEAHRLAARSAMKLDAPDVASRHVRRILELKSDDLEAWQLLAVVHLRRGEYGRAIYTLNELIRQNRAEPGDYFNLAVAFAQQEQVEDTVDTLAAAALRWQAATVYPWLSAHEFEAVREDVRFRTLEQQLDRNLSAVPTALRPVQDRADQALGLLPEPFFTDRPIELRSR